jgi:small subunit ribosomal protein S8
MTDPIADYLTRLRNAIKANHRIVEIPSSKLKKEITKVLFEKGYILNYKFDDVQNHQGISTPGLRMYSGVSTMPRVINGLGVAILTTSKGVMTDKEARKLNVGGEVLCYVY